MALNSTTPFFEPRAIRSVNGYFSTTLEVKYAEFAIGSDKVKLRTYNGGLVGPTFRVKPGDVLEIKLRNRLPDELPHSGDNLLHGFNTTNLHTHGLHVSPKGRSDNVLLQIRPGEDFDYRIEIPEDHPTGTFWYHAHSHGAVAAQVSSGMSGAIIIEGGMDDIPELAAAQERIFVLQQIPYVTEHGTGVIEERYAAEAFGPFTWDKLGRHTTINGQLFPVIKIQKGSVERWRFIHGGVREGMGLKLVGVDGPATGKEVTLQEIARDGLPLDRLTASQYGMVELFPGYRLDVLVKPNFSGTYLLEDAELKPAVSVFTQNPDFHPKYLAKIVVPEPVDGTPVDMPLPTDEQLANVRKATHALEDLRQVPKTNVLKASYGINPKGESVEFVIDGRSYGTGYVRRLRLGAVDEWELTSSNGVGAVDHPFHIHVNPFQIVEVLEPNPQDAANPIKHEEMNGWRDTLLMRDKWTYKVRMKYAQFTGTFVQHCHILDHEDMGMMELVEIYDPNGTTSTLSMPHARSSARESSYLNKTDSVSFGLPDQFGKMRLAKDFQGKPTLLIFYKGLGCPTCAEQLEAFSKRKQDFEKFGVRLVAISTDSPSDLTKALRERPYANDFVFLSDTNMQAFRDFGAFKDNPRHGLFLLSETGQLAYSFVGDHPIEDVDFVLKQVIRPNVIDSARQVNFASTRGDRIWAMVEIASKSTGRRGQGYGYWTGCNDQSALTALNIAFGYAAQQAQCSSRQDCDVMQYHYRCQRDAPLMNANRLDSPFIGFPALPPPVNTSRGMTFDGSYKSDGPND